MRMYIHIYMYTCIHTYIHACIYIYMRRSASAMVLILYCCMSNAMCYQERSYASAYVSIRQHTTAYKGSFFFPFQRKVLSGEVTTLLRIE